QGDGEARELTGERRLEHERSRDGDVLFAGSALLTPVEQQVIGPGAARCPGTDVRARSIHQHTSREAGGAWRRGPHPRNRLVIHSDDRGSSNCGRDSGGPRSMPREGGPRRHPPGFASFLMNTRVYELVGEKL